ncbi:MAG TPA: hypothetical protein VHA11_12590 [Bryobacteraceae bacterium]|nr:hypothetical protein [Bryobacteraceae bacterium]
MIEGVTAHEVLLQYESRMGELQAGLDQARLHGALAAVALGMALGLFLIFGLLAIRRQASVLLPSLPVPLLAASARRFRKNRQSQFRMGRLRRFYARAVQRVQGNWAGHGVSGEEFADSAHRYASDLNVFGEGSLFELLCTARTAIGRRGLAKYLLETPAVGETLLRQEAVRELRDQADLRERVALLGEFEFVESRWETFAEWLGFPAAAFPGPLRAAALTSSTLVAGTVVGGIAGLFPWMSVAAWIAPLLAFHAAVGIAFRSRVRRMLAWLGPVSAETSILRQGLILLEEQRFRCPKLRQLADRVRNSAQPVRKLDRLLRVLSERNKEMFYGPSLLLLGATQLCMAIERWRIEHAADLLVWLDAWAEFEALNSLANYAYENPDNAFPEFSRGEAAFEAGALGHPLLPEETCVRNDVRLNRRSCFYVLSGSNMSGKSTLLRAIGLNAVLAFAGAPVRAAALRLSRLSVYASLSVVDSLLNGTSRFMAEMERLRVTLRAALHGEPVLFLIDEILSGTNSHDRRIAAEAVVRTLVGGGAIGVLSTHDLALTAIATPALGGVNVHTGSRNGNDPLDCDYRLKPGVTTEANALAIARMAGVPV